MSIQLLEEFEDYAGGRNPNEDITCTFGLELGKTTLSVANTFFLYSFFSNPYAKFSITSFSLRDNYKRICHLKKSFHSCYLHHKFQKDNGNPLFESLRSFAARWMDRITYLTTLMTDREIERFCEYVLLQESPFPTAVVSQYLPVKDLVAIVEQYAWVEPTKAHLRIAARSMITFTSADCHEVVKKRYQRVYSLIIELAEEKRRPQDLSDIGSFIYQSVGYISRIPERQFEFKQLIKRYRKLNNR